MMDIDSFIASLPKIELHVHLEGTLEAETRFALAERNGLELEYDTVEELRASYIFHDLPSFLDVFYRGSLVLLKAEDFSDLCYAYLKRVAAQNVVYSEMFFDPQQHTDRGVPFETVIDGLTDGRMRAERDFGIKSGLIMCFVRERGPESAMATLNEALPHRDKFLGIGFDSDENNNPPSRFANIYEKARAENIRVTVHCDLDIPGTHEHIRQVIDDYQVGRIDHGANILEVPELIAKARDKGIHFTICPFANDVIRGKSSQDIVARALEEGLKFSLNSDDPAYFGYDYMNGSFDVVHKAIGFTKAQMVDVSRNALDAAWLSEDDRRVFVKQLDDFAAQAL